MGERGILFNYIIIALSVLAIFAAGFHCAYTFSHSGVNASSSPAVTVPEDTDLSTISVSFS